ncbi:MAG: hypothetical protein AAGG00_09195 [Cyanobacteria bacterium P01_H01_bin.150]
MGIGYGGEGKLKPLTKHMGLIPHRHTVEELGWGLNPHPNSSLQPSAFCLQPFFNL